MNFNPTQFFGGAFAPLTSHSVSNQSFGGSDPANSSWYGAATDPFVNDVITQWFMPGDQQDKQFAQQMYQIDYQNAYNDPAADMERKRRAGINPNTAAAGIAGAPNTSATPSAVPQTPQGITPADIAGVANAATGGIASLGEAADKFGLLGVRKNQIISDTFLKYKEAGYNEEMAKGLAIANAYLPTEKFLGIVSLEGQIDNLHAEYQTMIQGIEESKARIKEIDAQIKLAESTGNLNDKLALEAEKRALLIESQTTEQNWFNDKRKELDIDPKSPIENNIFMLGCKYGRDNQQYQTSLGILYDTQYNSQLGKNEADVQKAYDLMFNQNLAAENAKKENSTFLPIFQKVPYSFQR